MWGFILGTGGLLGWAAARRVLEARRQRGESGLPLSLPFLGRAPSGFGGLGLGGGGSGGATTAAGDRARGAYVQVPVRGEGAGGLR